MVQENKSAGYKARTEPDSKELLRARTTKQEGKGQRETTDGLESQHGTDNVEPKGFLNVDPVVDNMGPHTVAIAGMP